MNAEKDIELLTGIRIPHSTQHRLGLNYEVELTKITKRAEALSVDGGSVRIRTPLGEKSEWKQYKAIKIQDRAGGALFQQDEELIAWVNQQPLSNMVTCLGDGHDGVWNVIKRIGNSAQRREVLDWYHLTENLYKVGGERKRLKKVKNYLWEGLVKEAREELEGLDSKPAQNFRNYLNKHQSRIPDYQLYQELGIGIGSGGVESLIKQIATRMKITGSQWEQNNVSQMLKLRCAYLNGDLALTHIPSFKSNIL